MVGASRLHVSGPFSEAAGTTYQRRAAGASSRRLQYPSKNRVDFGCFSRTSVKSASDGNCR
jgi:hypothetical protein